MLNTLLPLISNHDMSLLANSLYDLTAPILQYFACPLRAQIFAGNTNLLILHTHLSITTHHNHTVLARCELSVIEYHSL